MAVAAGWAHSVALKNDGTLVEWGDNSGGQSTVPAKQPTAVVTTYYYTSPPGFQTNNYPPIVVKLIAAGGYHTLAAISSPLVQYPINVSRDLLLIYNTNSLDSSNVCQYYLSHRPMVSNANVLGIGCATGETILPSDYTNVIAAQVGDWLTNNPTKRPAYIVLFQDIPSRANTDLGPPYSYAPETPSVQYQLNHWCAVNWHPFVTSINMNGILGTNDCIMYINKLISFAKAYSPGQLLIGPTASGYGNTNYYFDDTRYGYGSPNRANGASAESGVLSVNAGASITYSNAVDGGLENHIASGLKLAAYLCWGQHSSLGMSYATNNFVKWTGANNGWWVIRTLESFNGQRDASATGQGNFLMWFSSGAFGGANYANTPVAAVSYTDEPTEYGTVDATYFGLWESGKTFANCAWNSLSTPCIQAVGDPFVIK
jgi:hypothetical protein